MYVLVRYVNKEMFVCLSGCLFVCLFLCLFVWGFSSHARIFQSYGDVNIISEGLQVMTVLNIIISFRLIIYRSKHDKLIFKNKYWFFKTRYLKECFK